MQKESVSETEIRMMDNYLKGYCLNRRLLRLNRYEQEYFGWQATEEDLPGEEPLARARMFEIRHFITDMNNSTEKLLLYYHYIRGESVERCGELLNISRAGAYRLKKRAITAAVRHAKESERRVPTEGSQSTEESA
ncbi:MAG: hypothetical protein E7668_02875 [Ruminococcaceae bacterium]|nr:hypothetical protein [Oscillospiraceae bacterium]